MAKRRKRTEIHMIDMTSRSHIKIVKATVEEQEAFQEELDEINIALERRMMEYEISIKKMIMSAISRDLISTTEKDGDYFIEKYKKQFENRNSENIRNRIQQYQRLIEEREN